MRFLYLFVLFFSQVFGATFYANQSGLGSADGSSLGNAASMVTLNARTNSGDDNIILNGTLTTPLVIHDSGTSGHPITYTFASGSKFSKGNWFQSGTNGDAAIYASGKNYITIDGASTGIIECTGNGTPPAATQTDCIGIFATGSCSNWTIKNLTIQNIYVRTNGTESNAYGNCVKFDSATGTGNVIDSCTMNNSSSDIFLAYGAGYGSFEVKNSSLADSGEGVIVIGSTGGTSTTTSVLIHDNTLTQGLKWSGQAAIHTNLIHCNGFAAGSQLNGVKVYNNTFTGNFGTQATSWLYFEGYLYSPLAYNNVFVPITNDFIGNGIVTVKGTQNAVIANNTFVGVSDAVAIGTTNFGALQTGLIIKNNVCSNTATGVFDNGSPQFWSQTGASYDYNVYYPSGMNFAAGTGFDTFAQWKTEIASQISGGIGGDTHSTQSTPNLNGSYIPVSPSSAIGTGSNFADMSAYYTTDKAGRAWSGGTGWGGGAFKETASVSVTSVISGKVQLLGKVQIK